MKRPLELIPRLTLGLTLALATAGCSGSSSDGGAVVQRLGASFQSVDRPLLQSLGEALDTVSYQGQRVVRSHIDLFGVPQVLVTRELVTASGDGRYSIDPIEVAEPQMSPLDEEWFKLMQKERQTFFFRYRDFRIRNYELFLSNYDISEEDPVLVANRRCTEIDIRPKQDAETYYRVAVDEETNVILRVTEHTTQGQLVFLTEFETFNLNPSLEGFELIERRDQAETFDLVSGAGGVGFEVLQPSLPPAGYQLSSTETQIDPSGRKWAKLIYTDGLENVFFMHTPKGFSHGAGVQAIPVGTNRVRTLDVGPWSVAQGWVNDNMIIAMGKVDIDDLLLMVQSALP